LFPSRARFARPVGVRPPRGLVRCSALGMEALLGWGVDGWSIETSHGFGLTGLGRGGWGAFPSWLNTEGGVLREPVVAALSASSLDTAAPRSPPLPPSSGTGHSPVLARKLQVVLQKLQFSAGHGCGPRCGKGLGAA